MDPLNPSPAVRFLRWRAVFLALAMLADPAAHSGAQVPTPPSGQIPEYDIKAAFLLNFARFVTWPPAAFADAHSPFSICVLGRDPFDGALDQLVAGESVNGRRVVLQRLKSPPRPKACQILFVGGPEKDLPAVLEGLGTGVLTVGEQPGFLHDGGMIQFVVENRHVRFDINQRAASHAALTLSARLLRVARSVQKE